MFTTSDLLTEVPSIAHAFFTRQGGVSEGAFASLNCGWSSGDDVRRVAENRCRVAAVMRVPPERLLTCKQVHSPHVVQVTTAWNPAERPDADAMVTDRPGLALSILTADCVPLLLADPAARVIGAAHAGWRGALQGVVANTVAAMRQMGARPDHIRAALGPCIWQENYEVGPDFPQPFLEQDAGFVRYFTPSLRAGHHLFDLPGLVTAQLQAAGITQIGPSPADTFVHSEQYFSYRRNTLQKINGTGSLLSVIALSAG